MKIKISVKEQLVDFMLKNGNSFRYTDMIKAVLKISTGKEYDWRTDRGYYADNFYTGSGLGYMVNGSGDCGVYKGEDNRWHAKYYTKEEKLSYKLKSILRNFQYAINGINHTYKSQEMFFERNYKLSEKRDQVEKAILKAYRNL